MLTRLIAGFKDFDRSAVRDDWPRIAKRAAVRTGLLALAAVIVMTLMVAIAGADPLGGNYGGAAAVTAATTGRRRRQNSLPTWARRRPR